MKPEIKQMWVDALRSGKYRQGDSYLRVENSFCCLGVLCDLHARATGGEWNGGHYFGAWLEPPLEVVKWSGLGTSVPKTHSGLYLADLNDGERTGDGKQNKPATFRQIADIIETEF
jgi:hypothetical protein